jgi:hypothetical protein
LTSKCLRARICPRNVSSKKNCQQAQGHIEKLLEIFISPAAYKKRAEALSQSFFFVITASVFARLGEAKTEAVSRYFGLYAARAALARSATAAKPALS